MLGTYHQGLIPADFCSTSWHQQGGKRVWWPACFLPPYACISTDATHVESPLWSPKKCWNDAINEKEDQHMVSPLQPKISASPAQPLLFWVVWIQRRALMSVQKRDWALLTQGKPLCTEWKQQNKRRQTKARLHFQTAVANLRFLKWKVEEKCHQEHIKAQISM